MSEKFDYAMWQLERGNRTHAEKLRRELKETNIGRQLATLDEKLAPKPAEVAKAA